MHTLYNDHHTPVEFKIFPFGPVVIPSELHPLNSVATLRCVLTLSPGVDYESQWTGPGDVGVINPAMSDRYTVFHTTYESQNEADPDWSGTKLLIHKLSYQDAGLYTCSGRRRVESKLASSWVAATINLQLDRELRYYIATFYCYRVYIVCTNHSIVIMFVWVFLSIDVRSWKCIKLFLQVHCTCSKLKKIGGALSLNN